MLLDLQCIAQHVQFYIITVQTHLGQMYVSNAVPPDRFESKNNSTNSI